jgi:NAD(P)-dependent dehydrogenase (short-subunit alcohol dehydrogenase family)
MAAERLIEEQNMDKLKGKVAIVTGGAGGIGRAYALRLALLGADVAIVDIDLGVAARFGETLTAASVMEEVKALGGRSIGIEADLSQQARAADAIEQIARAMGRIDILVNNAGGAITPIDRSRPSEAPFEDTEKLFAVNFYSMVHCCQAAVPHLRKQGGAIVNVATNGVDRTPAGGRLAMYNSSKAAVVRYTESLAVELGPDGIRVNCISPGIIESARIKAQAAARNLGTDVQAKANPLRRLGTPEDCAGALEFFVTDLSRYVTGECMRVSGGATLVSST